MDDFTKKNQPLVFNYHSICLCALGNRIYEERLRRVYLNNHPALFCFLLIAVATWLNWWAVTTRTKQAHVGNDRVTGTSSETMLISIPKLLSTDYHLKLRWNCWVQAAQPENTKYFFQLDPFLFQICSAVPTYKYLSIRRQEVDVIEPITRRSDCPLRQHNA